MIEYILLIVVIYFAYELGYSNGFDSGWESGYEIHDPNAKDDGI